MSRECILVVVDYGKQSIFVEIVNLSLTEQDINELYTAMWTFHYENIEVELEHQIKKLEWEFSLIRSDLLNITSKKLLNIIKELFPDKLVEFSEENKYD